MREIASGFKSSLLILPALWCVAFLSPIFLPAQGHLKGEFSSNDNFTHRHEADRWYFGRYAGLDFRPQNPVADLNNDSINISASPAVMADSMGNILLFTDGTKVYNRLSQIMTNGDGLHGLSGFTMPVLIVPKPGSASIYYIFTTENTIFNGTVLFTLQDYSSIDSVYWQFGDPGSNSNTSTDFQPSHVFSGPGSYLVSVTEYYGGMAYGPYSETIVVTFNDIIEKGHEIGEFYRLYPNPGNGTLHLLFYPGTNEAVVSVINIIGQTVWGPCQYSDLEIKGEVVLKLDSLPEGVYFIQVKDDYPVSFSMKYFLRK